MRTLRKKLGRDLWRLRFQVFTIALVVGCGIASFVSSVAAYRSLEVSRDVFFAQARLADVFDHLDRAPNRVQAQIADIPGVGAVDGRVVTACRLELPGAGDSEISGQVVGVPAQRQSALNRPMVQAGRELEPGSSDEVEVSALFAQVHGIVPGSSIIAVINGRRARLRVVGISISPEYVWAVPPTTGLPDPMRFGVLWMDNDAVARADGREGAFNDVVVELTAAADPLEVERRLDVLLEPYGGLGSVLRSDQTSTKLVNQKIGQLQRMATIVPVLFLGVAAFLLNLLVSRIVSTQREQIATLEALGYTRREIALHYLALGGTICLFGVVFGGALGALGGRQLVVLYAQYFRFPEMFFRFDWRSLLSGAAVAVVFAVLGTLGAVRRALAIAPAAAMRPEPPGTYSATWVERLRLDLLLSPAAKMVLRDIERRPVRLLLSSASVALATAITALGGTSVDSIAEVLRLQFEVVTREQVTVTLDHARPARAVIDLAHVPGVVHAEGERWIPVRFRFGPRDKTSVIVSMHPGSDLHRLLDADRKPLRVPASGLGLSRVLATELGVSTGDVVEAEVLEHGRKKLRLPVTAVVDDLTGVSGYMDFDEASRRLDEAPSVTRVLLAADRADIDAITTRLRDFPAVASYDRPEDTRELFWAEVADAWVAMQVILTLFAAAIAVGVVYNNARIALETRSRDLATLRILGFTRGELATVLLGEQAVQLVIGIPAGLWLGKWMTAGMLSTIDRELLRIPVVITPMSQVAAASGVVLAALLSMLRVRRQSDHLDLVAVLKARD